MTRTERKLLAVNGALGVALTLLVMLLDHLGHLRAIERWFYARRARDCQFFAKPPTSQIVFLDIDDPAIDTIGRWPWRRNTMATIVDEIAAARPRMIFLDIIYPEPADAPAEDQRLGAAIARASNVLVPFSISREPVPVESPLRKAAREHLSQDLELTPAQLAENVKAAGLQVPADEQQWLDLFVVARRTAMFGRIEAEMARRQRFASSGPITAADLRPLLLPRTDRRVITSPLIRLLIDQHARAEKLQPLVPFSRPLDPNLPFLLRRNEENEKTPVTTLSAGAGASGFVDYLPDDDGVVRRIPLLARFHDRVVPQVGLVVACNLLGADPNAVTADRHNLTIPLPGGGRRIVPVVTRPHSDTGEPIGVLMDIPFIGGRDWKTALDPRGRRPAQHLPMTALWQIVQTREAIEYNNSVIDESVGALEVIFSSAVEEYRAKKLDPLDHQTRLRYLGDFLKTIESHLKQYETITDPDEQEKKELEFLNHHRPGVRSLITVTRDLGDQLTRQRANLASHLSGKAVLVGSIATAMAYDMTPTPLHESCPGVVVHGVIANGIVSGELWRSAPPWVSRAITLAAGLLVTAVVLLLAPWRAALLSIALLLAYFAVNGVYLFDYHNLIVGVAGPVVAIALVWSTCQLVAFLVEKAERRRITSRFATYVDPDLVDWVIEHPEQVKMTGEVREMTVVFTDLAGFTAISEQLKERVIPLLNEYLGIMTAIIKRHGGTVNKFIGDGIMFFFNAPRPNPNHAADAAATVLEMQTALADYNQTLARRGLPEMIMRAGIVTGEMVVGDAGGPQHSDYTVLGDNVNLASRLEAANKSAGTTILMTQRTADLLGDGFVWRPIARLQVVGKTEGVITCELIARADQATPDQKKLAACSKAVFDCFVEGQFTRCLDAVHCMEQTCGGPTRLSTLYRDLAEQYQQTPPANGFDGSIVLSEK